jgi:hypothetical protein
VTIVSNSFIKGSKIKFVPSYFSQRVNTMLSTASHEDADKNNYVGDTLHWNADSVDDFGSDHC